MHLNASNMTDMGRRIPLASIRNETSGTEQGRLVVSVDGDVNAGELLPLVGPSCNDKIYQLREELRRDRGEGEGGVGGHGIGEM